MAITVTLPVEAPTGVTTTIIEGGNLEANTTYYYVMFASDYYTSPGSSSSRWAYHSPTTVEGSFTTTSTEKSVKFNWVNQTGTGSNGGVYYQKSQRKAGFF